MASEDTELSFWDHLDALRGTLVRSLLAVCIMTVIGLVFRNFLFDRVILAPACGDFFIYRWFPMQSDVNIVNLEISGQFMVHLRVSLMLGLVIAFPYIVWEIWRFIAPALYDSEKRGVSKAFLMSGALFYLGILVGYFILLPVCLSFFQGYTVSESISNTFSLQSYISLFGSMVLVIGLVFEFPVLIMALSSVGILTRQMLKKGRKYALVAVLILAAAVTPADLGSMILVSIPLYGLYELSILFSKKEVVEE